MQIEMTIKGVLVDPVTNDPIIILRDKDGERVLPIWVGVHEANAIGLQIENVAPERPMTHDLLRDVIGSIGADVVSVRVTELRDRTFYAELELRLGDRTVRVSSRPSDAIALAVRVDAPIYAAEAVLDEAAAPQVEAEVEEEQQEEIVDQFREFIDQVNPEDFG